jgi:hypothetical protein
MSLRRVRRGSRINSSQRRTALFRDAAFETFADHLTGQVAADENDSALALLIGFPRPLMIAVKDHVNTLKDEALIVVLERENAFASQNVRAFLLHEVLHPGKELIGIERLLGVERNRLHLLVVIVLQPGWGVGMGVRMRTSMSMISLLMIMLMVVMIAVLAAEKFRFQIEDAIEIKSIAA